MKNSSPKIPLRSTEPGSPGRRRRLEKVLKQFLAGKVSLMSVAAFDDAFLRIPYRRVHE